MHNVGPTYRKKGKKKAKKPAAAAPAADDLIYCTRCKVGRLDGCQLPGHEIIFDKNPNFEVGPSKIPKAGRGVFNGMMPVREGVMVNAFGYYFVESVA